MATNFPTTIDSLTNPQPADPLNSPSHSTQHINSNDAIEALEAKVGVDSSAVTTSLDYKVSNTSSSNPGHKHTLADGATDVTSTTAELNLLDGVTSTTAELNYTDTTVGTVTASKALVANASAEIALSNNKSLYGKNSGGTDYNLVRVDASDYAVLGSASLAGAKLYQNVAFKAVLTSNQSITINTFTKVTFSVERYDTGSNYNNSTYRFTAPIDGIYTFGVQVQFDGVAANTRAIVEIYKNGVANSEEGRLYNHFAYNQDIIMNMSRDIKLDAGDYIEVFVFQDTANPSNIIGSTAPAETNFSGSLKFAL